MKLGHTEVDSDTLGQITSPEDILFQFIIYFICFYLSIDLRVSSANFNTESSITVFTIFMFL